MADKKTTKNNKAIFDFDYWKNLAENNPEKFEQERTMAIDEVITAAPTNVQRRMRGLQWRIDMEIKRSKNSMDGCLRINQMMMDAVYSTGGLVESIEHLSGMSYKPQNTKTKPVVIQLPKRPST